MRALLLVLVGCGIDGVDITRGAAAPDGSAAGGAIAQGSCPATNRTGMVCIPPGDFLRGEPDARTDPVHDVTLSAFSIDVFEVTNADYKPCVTAGMCPPPALTTDFDDATKSALPVAEVTWKMADRYCSFAGKRLPTAAQWEKAARGVAPDLRPFPWGSGTPDCQQAILSHCGGVQNVGKAPGDVSPFGVHDLGGNLIEWVFDSHVPASGSVDPVAIPSPTAFTRALRGGGFVEGPVPISLDNGFQTDARFAYVGFRCAHSELSPVTARFGTASFQVAPGGLVHFDASSSLGATSWRWDFDGDGSFDTPFSSSPLSDQFYSEPGRFNVTVEAQGPGGSDRVSYSLLVTGNQIDNSPCDRDADCATGYLCSFESFAVCRKQCTQTSQCDSTQTCNFAAVFTSDANQPSGLAFNTLLCVPRR